MLEIVTHFMDLHGGTNLFTVLMCAPLLFIIIDIITGVARAWRDGEVSSKINREGAGHKFAIILAIASSSAPSTATSRSSNSTRASATPKRRSCFPC